jgi:hypothetical protein
MLQSNDTKIINSFCLSDKQNFEIRLPYFLKIVSGLTKFSDGETIESPKFLALIFTIFWKKGNLFKEGYYSKEYTN